MRRMHRLAVLTALLLAAPALSGCTNFDPDKLDVFGLNEKKKLPGERKALFPEGVPGVAQGVPPEYLKGNQPAPDAAVNADVSLPAGSKVNPGDHDASAALKPESEPAAKPAAKTAAVEPAEAPKPKAKRKPKPAAKPATAQHAPAQVTIQPAAQGQPQASPWPAQNQQPQQAQSPWPDANQTNNSSPWPAPPAPSTSR
jgi:hypothetical protein